MQHCGPIRPTGRMDYETSWRNRHLRSYNRGQAVGLAVTSLNHVGRAELGKGHPHSHHGHHFQGKNILDE